MSTDLQTLIGKGQFSCRCGKCHSAGFSRVMIGSGVTAGVPDVLESYGTGKVFILADRNTYRAAGERVTAELDKAGIAHTVFLLPGEGRAEPDERAVGSAVMHFDLSCDTVLGIGSGVINDIGKIISSLTGRQYVIYGTAPSMDGYASGTSSVIRDGLKLSLTTRVADTVIGDTDVLAAAPMRMILSGLGDMIAKYISIAEWKISNIINGEYYCDTVASLVTDGLNECMESLDGIPSRDKSSIAAVMNGMVLSGIAANYAGVTRPVSGMEHYLSHICDMRAAEFGTHSDLHGIQCGAATIECLKIYEKLRSVTPDREKALEYAAAFSYDSWKEKLRRWLGNGAEAMIANEAHEHKYDKTKHRERLDRIIGSWDSIQSVIRQLPLPSEIVPGLRKIGLPTSFAEIGFTEEETKNAVLFSRDVRDKYVGSRLMWDLGITDEIVG